MRSKSQVNCKEKYQEAPDKIQNEHPQNQEKPEEVKNNSITVQDDVSDVNMNKHKAIWGDERRIFGHNEQQTKEKYINTNLRALKPTPIRASYLRDRVHSSYHD